MFAVCLFHVSVTCSAIQRVCSFVVIIPGAKDWPVLSKQVVIVCRNRPSTPTITSVIRSSVSKSSLMLNEYSYFKTYSFFSDWGFSRSFDESEPNFLSNLSWFNLIWGMWAIFWALTGGPNMTSIIGTCKCARCVARSRYKFTYSEYIGYIRNHPISSRTGLEQDNNGGRLL